MAASVGRRGGDKNPPLPPIPPTNSRVGRKGPDFVPPLPERLQSSTPLTKQVQARLLVALEQVELELRGGAVVIPHSDPLVCAVIAIRRWVTHELWPANGFESGRDPLGARSPSPSSRGRVDAVAFLHFSEDSQLETRTSDDAARA